jgi:hypothetical protein
MSTLLLMLALTVGQPPENNVRFIDEGFIYPVVTEVDGPKTQHLCYNFAKDAKPGFNLKPGTYTLLTRNSTNGFPQPVEYVLKGAKGETIWDSGVTEDHKKIKISEGQTLEIRLQKPFLSYNGAKVTLPGTDVQGVVVGARPYWFYYANKGQFPLDAPEKYPNGIFFLADPEVGVKGVAKDLADATYAELRGKDPSYNHRGKMHWSFLHQATPEGKVPPVLLKVTKAQFETAFEKALENILQYNYHRPFNVETVRQLKKDGWLPATVPDRPMLVSLSQDVEYGKMYRERWLKQREEEKAAKKKN